MASIVIDNNLISLKAVLRAVDSTEISPFSATRIFADLKLHNILTNTSVKLAAISMNDDVHGA
jgi:hypothetical protein